MARAFIGMGSNIDPARNLREGLRLLVSAVHVLGISTVFQTEAIGRPDQSTYYNCVASVETPLQPLALKKDVLRRIENQLGRVRSSDRYDPRTIDLDLLLYGDLYVTEAGLELPDPDIPHRSFLARGLAELAPDLVLPGSGMAITDIASRVNEPAIRRLESYTEQLRGELKNGP